MSNATNDKVRHGKTARDKAKGHMAGHKNRKPPGERGHRGGK